MVRYAHETKTAFVSRVLRQHGFGEGKIKPIVRQKIEARSIDEILVEQITQQDRRASGAFRYGPPEKWRMK